MSGEETAIKVRGLTTAYGEHKVHEGLDLDVRKGEILGVIGPSGTGKSVLLRAIVGLKAPSEGTVEVFGENVTDLRGDELRKVQNLWGIMFQDGALFSNLTVRENVMVPMREHTDLPLGLMKQLADQKLRMSGLEDSAGPKFPSDLSGGMRKRAALARALALDPPILFLDEPTAGLDATSEVFILEALHKLSESGKTLVFSTHHQALLTLADRLLIVNDGEVCDA